MLTLLSDDLLHLVQPLQCMVCDAVPKHDDAKGALQVICGELLASMCFHGEVHYLRRVCACLCSGCMSLLSSLLTLTYVQTPW